jgi:hypothetical protein
MRDRRRSAFALRFGGARDWGGDRTIEGPENTEVAQRKPKPIRHVRAYDYRSPNDTHLPFLCATSVFSVSSVVQPTRRYATLTVAEVKEAGIKPE